MLLALDVGNTNTVLGLYRLTGSGSAAPELAAHWRVSTHRTQTADEYGVLFSNLFNLHGLATSEVRHIIISSVVPPVESTLAQVCESYFKLKPPSGLPSCNTRYGEACLRSDLPTCGTKSAGGLRAAPRLP